MLSFALLIFNPLWPQTGFLPPDAMQQSAADPASYIGLTLTELIRQCGIPKSVYAVRGLQEWQDDVVFIYDEGDFFILEDRVWQVKLNNAYQIKTGDPKSAVFLVFGETVSDVNDYAVYSVSGRNWPIALRFNFDSEGRVTMIFIYRSDL